MLLVHGFDTLPPEEVMERELEADAGRYDTPATQTVDTPESWAAQLMHATYDGQLVDATHEAERDRW